MVLQSKLAPLWQENLIQTSTYLVSHLSDVLRFLILHNFGGTYLDLDALILQKLPEASKNFVGRESWTKPYLAAGVLRFQKGHPVLEKFLDYMR